MELNITSIKSFFLIIIRSFYSLIPASFFLFFSCLFVCTYKVHFPPSIQPFLLKIEKLETANSVILFILTAFILTFINDTVSEILPWNKTNKDQNKEGTNNEDKKTVPKDYDLRLDSQIALQDIGIADLVGVKLIEEYENVNTWTFSIMAVKDMLLSINNYINIGLVLFLPFSLYIKEYKSSQLVLIFLILFQIILIYISFYLIRKPIFTFKESENWKNDTITGTWQIQKLFLFPLGSVALLLIPAKCPDCCLNGFLILIAINAFFLPIKLFIALTARNYHNNVRRMVNTAFFQIRFNDKIFKNSEGTLKNPSK